jgi:hypothetical protein
MVTFLARDEGGVTGTLVIPAPQGPNNGKKVKPDQSAVICRTAGWSGSHLRYRPVS